MAVGLLLFQSLDLHTGQLPARVSTDETLKAAAEAQFPLFSFVPNLEVLQCRAELRTHTHTHTHSLTHSLSRRTINRLRADFSFTLPIVNFLSCSVNKQRESVERLTWIARASSSSIVTVYNLEQSIESEEKESESCFIIHFASWTTQTQSLTHSGF